MASKPKKLTAKQRIFCENYIVDWNATKAAIAAGYSEKTARFMGHENLTKPNILDFIEEIQKDISKLAGVSALGNLLELKKMLEVDKETGQPKESTKDRIKVLEVINKMQGLNAASKLQIDGSLDISTLTSTERNAKIEELRGKLGKSD